MKRTEEQQAILDHIGTKNCFSVQARAGTGKSTTGAMICKSRSSKRIKYVSFTRDNADDLKKKMPANVDCSTWNSFGVKSFDIIKIALVTLLRISIANNCQSVYPVAPV